MALKLPDSAVPMGDFPVAKAVDIDFDDGENLQEKLDDGKLGGAGGGNVYANTPIGTVLSFAGQTPPNGYLLCDGRSYVVADYQDLYDVIGNTYGGDAENFNVPNLIDKFIQGSNTSGTEKEAGLPNITGDFHTYDYKQSSPSGVFKKTIANENSSPNVSASTGDPYSKFEFNANRSNSIYGNSNTVQPPALTMVYIIKAFHTNEGVDSSVELEDNVINHINNRIENKVKEEISTKANDDEVVKKTDITDTIDIKSSGTKIPNVKAIYNDIIEGKLIDQTVMDMYGTEILKYPLGIWRIGDDSTANKFSDLPVKTSGRIEITSIDVDINKNPWNIKWSYRTYNFETYNGANYFRKLSSEGTAGVSQDTGWQKIATQKDLDELFQSVSSGKTLVANAITDKGVSTATNATFATMASNISNISNITTTYKEETKSKTFSTTGISVLTITFSANVLAVKRIVAPSNSCSIVLQSSNNIYTINGKELIVHVTGGGTWSFTALIQN